MIEASEGKTGRVMKTINIKDYLLTNIFLKGSLAQIVCALPLSDCVTSGRQKGTSLAIILAVHAPSPLFQAHSVCFLSAMCGKAVTNNNTQL